MGYLRQEDHDYPELTLAECLIALAVSLIGITTGVLAVWKVCDWLRPWMC